MKNYRVIPIFFAADDGYVQFMMVTMKSIIANTGSKYRYRMHVLHTDITLENQKLVKRMETRNCKIHFHNVTGELQKIEKKLSIRDYYSSTTYYRVFIAEMFPQYDKVLYVDSDTIIRTDIAELYNYSLGFHYIGAVRDQLVVQTDIYGDYVEKVLGISRGAYFNAGVVLLNCAQFRRKKILKQFVELLSSYSFVVAQDQDYLNILCKDHVLWLDPRWNVQMVGTIPCDEDKIKLVHYNLAMKPWHYKDCRFGDFFWEYAKETAKYQELLHILHTFSEEERKKDVYSGEHLKQLAIDEINNDNNYYNLFGNNETIKLDRIEILRRIAEYEKQGRFDEDVEQDPPARELLPNEVDYLRKNLKNRFRTKYAFKLAHWFVDILIRKKQFVIKEIKGIEHFRNLNSGAIITCNHFSALDSFAMHLVYEKSRQYGRKLFRIIREGNYTSFPGFYGFLMRNCNTLPLSSNKATMKKFMKAVDKILQKGHFILIYPEQSMWWNYRKPKPLKKGGFTFAAKNDVPVLPCFITMEDTEVMDADGFPVQAYTIHVAPPIYPDRQKSKAENTQMMLEKNYEIWKQIYEETYKIPLTYTCDEE